METLLFKPTGKYQQQIVGESHYQEQLDFLASIYDDGLIETVDLFLEDHNAQDSNAVTIVIEGEDVGHLSREDALKYRKKIKELGHPVAIGICPAKLIGGHQLRSGEQASRGITLDLDIDSLTILEVGHTRDVAAQSVIAPASIPPKSKKEAQKIPFIPVKGKGCLFFFVLLPLIAIVNFYILFFWLISKGIQWLWKIATATPQSKKISLIAVGSLSALWIVTALISALLQAVGITSAATPPAPTIDALAIQNTALAEAWLSYTQTAAALPTNTLLPTDTPAPLPTLTLAPVATATATTFLSILPANQTPTQASVQQAVCSCSGDTLNCGDFSSHSSAQACFNYCVSQGAGDIHGLDRDGNNLACEALP